jgi:hypothetical protein
MVKCHCFLYSVALLYLNPSSNAVPGSSQGSAKSGGDPMRVPAVHFIQCRHSAFVFPTLARSRSNLRAALDTRYSNIKDADSRVSINFQGAQNQNVQPTNTYPVNRRSKFHGRPQFKEPVEIPAREEHTATVIYLHGFGSDGPGRGKDLPELLNLPWVKYLVPIAPVRRPLQIGQALQSWATIDPVESITRQAQILAGAAGRLISGEAQVGARNHFLSVFPPC